MDTISRKALLCILAAALLAPAAAKDAAARKPKRRQPPAQELPGMPPEAQPSEPEKKEAPGADKASLEAYLKARGDRIKEMHRENEEFIGAEAQAFKAFWEKMRDERLAFEVSTTRHRLDLFEQLASLDPKDYGPPLQDFDKYQGNVAKAFEEQQKRKTQDFFSERETRWKEFTARIEKNRQAMADEAEQSWREQKAAVRITPGSRR